MSSANVQMYPSGNTIDLLNPDPAMIEIEDIAHALSMLPRWTASTRFPYSVGQHSIWCYRHVIGPELGIQALMHDATEAYVNDLCAPLKRHLPKYTLIEGQIWCAIAERFNIPEILDPRVKEVDVKALIAERMVLKADEKIVSKEIRYQHHSKTRKEFMGIYRMLEQKLQLKKSA